MVYFVKRFLVLLKIMNVIVGNIKVFVIVVLFVIGAAWKSLVKKFAGSVWAI